MLSHEVDLAVIAGPACLLCALFCFASFLFSLLDKFFLYSERKPMKLFLTQLSFDLQFLSFSHVQ